MRVWFIFGLALTVTLPAAAQPPKPYVDERTETRRARERDAHGDRQKPRHHREPEQKRPAAMLPPRPTETKPAAAPRPYRDEKTEIRRAPERDAHRHREPTQPTVAPRPYIDEKAEIRRAQERDAQRYREPTLRARESDARPQSTAASRSITCRAAPVCGQAGSRCRPVEWTYTGTDTASYRRDIARLCEVANTPDGCGCVSQCARTVSCSF